MLKFTLGKLALGGLLLAVLLGGAVAANAQGTHPGQGTKAGAGAHPAAAKAKAIPAGLADVRQFLNAELGLVAKTIGIAEADLKKALKNGQTPAQLAQAHNMTAQTVITTVVNDITAKAQARPAWARLTDAQKSAFTTKVQTAVANFVNNGVGANVRPALPKIANFEKDAVRVAAKTIGVTPAALRTALKGDQTVAQVAQAHKVDPQTVITAVVNDITAKAQARPGWTKLTDAQKSQFTTQAQDRVTAWVNGTAKKTQ